MQPRPGLAEVARQSGVSVSTASRALNRPEMVNPEVVGRIREAAKRLGYVPNPFARSLRLQASKTIGLIVPDHSNPFFAEVARGIESACFRAGYALVLCNSDRSHQKEADQARILFENRAAGVLLFTLSNASAPNISWLLDHDVPVVLIERRAAGTDVDCVLSDNAGGVRAALTHLASLGHRRVAFLGGDPAASHQAERLASFEQLATELSLDSRPQWVRTGLTTFTGGQAATTALLAAAERPTAIVCAADSLAVGALRAAAQAGVHVPADLSVTGFGDIELASYVNPPLTAVAQQKEAAGTLAVRLLLRRIRQRAYDDQPCVTRMLATHLVVRESTGPAPAAVSGIEPEGDSSVPVRRGAAMGRDGTRDEGLWGLD